MLTRRMLLALVAALPTTGALARTHVLSPRAGDPIRGPEVSLKVAAGESATTSVFVPRAMPLEHVVRVRKNRHPDVVVEARIEAPETITVKADNFSDKDCGLHVYLELFRRRLDPLV